MRKISPFLCVLAFLVVWTTMVDPQAEESSPPAPKTSYLGQKTPGTTPEIFAPGIVSTGMFTRDVAMTPDGKEFYFSVVVGQFNFATILVTREGPDGKWTKPEVCPFASDPACQTLEPCISPDGRHFFFASNRPKREGKERDFNIWAMDRKGDSWGDPYQLPAPVNTDAAEFFPSVTRWDTLYYTRENPDGTNTIHRSVWKDGRYQTPDKLPANVNCGADRFNAFVAPLENFVILSAVGLKESIGGVDYYIVFRNPDDTWSGPVNLGPAVNTNGSQEYSPFVSLDGKYLFFMSGRARQDAAAPAEKLTAARLKEMHNSPGFGNPAIWWVDAGFLEGLRPSKKQ